MVSVFSKFALPLVAQLTLYAVAVPVDNYSSCQTLNMFKRKSGRFRRFVMSFDRPNIFYRVIERVTGTAVGIMLLLFSSVY